MDRYQAMFTGLESKKQGAFIPFVMLGDPDEETCFSIISSLIEGGADALELGIPFSDPIADGPTIQKASLRALGSDITPDICFRTIRRIRDTYPDIPVGLLLYSNLIFAKGLNGFYQQAAQAGVDSILVADVPLREAQPFMQAAKSNGVKHILIAPPNASDETLAQIGELSEGYTYLLGRAGVTGTETAVTMPATDLVAKLTRYKAAPPVLGFGISQPQQVAEAISASAAGAISGSATVNIIAAHLDNPQIMRQKLTDFVSTMKQATC